MNAQTAHKTGRPWSLFGGSFWRHFYALDNVSGASVRALTGLFVRFRAPVVYKIYMLIKAYIKRIV